MQDERDNVMKRLGPLTCLNSQAELLSKLSELDTQLQKWVSCYREVGIIRVPTRHRVWLIAGSQSMLTRSMATVGTLWGTLLLMPSRPPGASLSFLGYSACPSRYLQQAHHGFISAPCSRKSQIILLAYVCAKSLQLCLTLHNPMDCSLPGSSIHGILQARILEWVARPSSRGSSAPQDWNCVSCISGGCFTTKPLGKPPDHPYLFFKAQFKCHLLQVAHDFLTWVLSFSSFLKCLWHAHPVLRLFPGNILLPCKSYCPYLIEETLGSRD